MNNALMFGKASDEWSTPQEFYAELNDEFDFMLDVAASRENRKCGFWLGPEQMFDNYRDGLTFEWSLLLKGTTSACWMNPPYSRCREFIAKAALEASKGCKVVALVPSRTDTRWWHDHVWDVRYSRPRPGVEVRFVKGRLKFGGATAGAPFPSVVIVFRPVNP